MKKIAFLIIFLMLLPVKLYAKSFPPSIVMDETGNVLYKNLADAIIPPASLTKILTLYIVFDFINAEKVFLNDTIVISSNAASTKGSRMFLTEGEVVTLEELIIGAAVESANDACVAMAEYVAGSEENFLELMRDKISEVGLTSTRIMNVHGLPAIGAYTTAHDMAVLGLAYINAHPEALYYSSLPEHFYRITQRNHNSLLRRDASVDGLKTGYTQKSRYNIIVTALRDGNRIIVVVMSAKNRKVREREALRLLDYGFKKVNNGTLWSRTQKAVN